MNMLSSLAAELERLPGSVYHGTIKAGLGATLEVSGLERHLAMGDKCVVRTLDGREILCETVGFRDGRTQVMPFDSLEGVTLGCPVLSTPGQATVRPSLAWRGRVLNALGEAIDGLGPLPQGDRPRRLRASAPPACARRRVGKALDTGVRAMNCFVPVCRGQRMGLFAGSGVGKSTLLGMLARGLAADAVVIGLVGERGREVQEFLQHDLGEAGRCRSVLVVATSDESALMRRQAAHLTLAVAEAFRDQGLQVLCLMDSLTRFAMAQREIGLAAGEPPTAKGYPPSVFAELPRLLERAGPGTGTQGDITGVFTVLVDGDDHDEPIADAVRGILDGHLVLDRRIAQRGRYPAIDVLRSVSRTLPQCHSEEENGLTARAREVMACFEDMRELVQIGAYRSGSNPRVDQAVALHQPLEAFLAQGRMQQVGLAEAFGALAEILGDKP